jgi:hypothetical protein
MNFTICCTCRDTAWSFILPLVPPRPLRAYDSKRATISLTNDSYERMARMRRTAVLVSSVNSNHTHGAALLHSIHLSYFR